ncbi:MAG: hypothetical protein R6V53_00960 [Candidatus Woesearchaeota archaeon]
MSNELFLAILYMGMVVSSFFLLYFCIRIIKITKGSNKGWLFYGLFGVTNGIVSIAGIFPRVVTEPMVVNIAYSIQSFLLFIETFFIIIGITILAEVFGLESKVFSRRNVLVVMVLSFFTILGFAGTISPLKMYSIVSMVLVIGLVLTMFPVWNIMKTTKKLPWKLLVASHIMSMISLYLIFASLGCCAGPIDDPACHPGDYLVIPAPCSGTFVTGFPIYLMGLLIGTWLLTGSFYYLYKGLKI